MNSARTGWLLAIALPLLAVSDAAIAACRHQMLTSLSVELDARGAIMVPVVANGQDMWMTLDLSGGIPVISPQTVRALGLVPAAQVDYEGLRTVDGVAIDSKVMLDSLRVGTLQFTRAPLYVLPAGGAGPAMFAGRPVLGQLPSGFLRLVDVEIDLANRRLNLFAPDRCGAEVVHWGGEVTTLDIYHDGSGLMIFPVDIDGTRFEAAFDTTAAASGLSGKVAQRYFSAGDDAAELRVGSLAAEGLVLRNVRLRLADDSRSPCAAGRFQRVLDTGRAAPRVIGFERCVSRTPVTLGTDLLAKLRIYIASREGRLYLTAAEAPPR